MSTSLGSSSVAERSIDRFTVAVAIIWFACIVSAGLIDRFSA